MASRKFNIPHVFVLLTLIIFICSLLTYIIPSGKFEREERYVEGIKRTLIIPNTFEEIPKHYSIKNVIIDENEKGKSSPISLMGFLSSIPKGMEKSADIIFFIFIIGGVFGIIQRTGTITALLQKILKIFKDSPNILVIILMVIIGVASSTLGMGEEFIPLIPLFLLLSKELGYDRISGVAIIWVAAEIGFSSATTNPFTVQIAQNLSELPLNSGIFFRVLFFTVTMSIGIVYVLRYANKVKLDKNHSLIRNDEFNINAKHYEEISFSKSHLSIIILGTILFAIVIYSVQKFNWWMNEMSAAFLLLGILSVIISNLSLKEASSSFVKGMEEMVVAALVVGFARGVQVVLQEGNILDTIIFYASNTLQLLPKYLAAGGMLIFQTILNFFIPSGSGQAAVTMPIMAPLSDLLGISRQIAVFAFTCGDGFANMIIPTSGLLMAVLGVSKVPYNMWIKFITPLFVSLLIISYGFILIGLMIGF